jgi:DNA-binding MarR family transcriptional regulator
VPRLDAERIALWQGWQATSAEIERRLDELLVEQTDLPLRWFEVLAALAHHGGSMRVHELRNELATNASSLSRRLDRMEDGGYITRDATPVGDDRRSVTVWLSREGRLAWRDANIIFRRGVQQQFAHVLTESDIGALQRVLSKLRTATTAG